jgi:hypothetical protein
VALIDMQRQLLALCFRAEPDEAAFAALGDARAFRAYREMVRERLWRQLRTALPRTSARVPHAAFERAFVWQLEHEPPRTRYFRGIVRAFADSALPLWAADESVPAVCRDWLRYELALWEVADAPGQPAEPCGEFSFEGVAVVAPALRLLRLSHAVHAPAGSPGEWHLCVHRSSDEAHPRTYRLTKTTYALLERLQRADANVSDQVRALAAESGAALDARYVDAVCETLAQFLEDGLVLGSR